MEKVVMGFGAEPPCGLGAIWVGEAMAIAAMVNAQGADRATGKSPRLSARCPWGVLRARLWAAHLYRGTDQGFALSVA